MTKVDPFIPVNGSSRRRPVQQAPIAPIHVTPFRGSRDVHSVAPKKRLVQTPRVIAPRTTGQMNPQRLAKPVVQPVPVSPEPTAQQTEVRLSFARRLLKNIQMLLLVCGAIILGFAIQYPPIGYAIIAIYALVVALRRIRSRVTFTLALVSVAAAMLARGLQREEGMADSFAIYTFLLLTIGTITFLIEVFHANRHLKRGT